jgi:hypothetical protein
VNLSKTPGFGTAEKVVNLGVPKTTLFDTLLRHRIKMKRILLLTFIVGLSLVSSAAQKNIVLAQKQAVALAEKFVAENGYTDKRPVQKRLSLETGEKRSDIKNILAARFDSIEAWAVFAVIKEVDGQPVWSVQFRLVEQNHEKQQKEEKQDTETIVQVYDYTREVRMSLDGRKIWMEKSQMTLPARYL